MITYKVGICDDEPEEVKKIEDLLHEYEATHNVHFEIHPYTNGLKLLSDYREPYMLHALFLDVEMPVFNGIDLAEQLRSLPDRDLHIIFVSAYPQYMKDSFSVQAFQYISKPFKKEEFMQEVSRFIEDYQQSQSVQVVIPDGEKNTSSIQMIFIILNVWMPDGICSASWAENWICVPTAGCPTGKKT